MIKKLKKQMMLNGTNITGKMITSAWDLELPVT